MFNKNSLDRLIKLRHNLHHNAELSNQEAKTAEIIKAYIKYCKPDKYYENIGGHGLVFKFNGNGENKLNIGFRADIDALPIDETIDLPYGSDTKDVSHKCGHDGHSAMVAGIAEILSHRDNLTHNYYLIFQPAEEIGTGAKDIINFLNSKNIKLDYIIGLHNLPGYDKGQIVTRAGSFASASTGMTIKLKGKTSHAAEPENGISPAISFSKIIQALYHITDKVEAEELVLCTVIHGELGKIAFGTTPGYAEIRATLRANRDKDLNKLVSFAEQTVKNNIENNALKYSIEYCESFPSTYVEENDYNKIIKVAEQQKLSIHKQEAPFKWSEDFGHYKSIAKCIFFGLGAGKDSPKLHNGDYDFPDEIMENGISMYEGLINSFEGEPN